MHLKPYTEFDEVLNFAGCAVFAACKVKCKLNLAMFKLRIFWHWVIWILWLTLLRGAVPRLALRPSGARAASCYSPVMCRVCPLRWTDP